MSPDVEQPRLSGVPRHSGSSARPVANPAGAQTNGRSAVAAATAETVEAAEATVRRDHPELRGAHPDHHVLRDGSRDRWKWRAKIRRNPHQLRLYRVVVAFVGTFFIALGCVSGPLPGPGGIPLVLLGLAIWSSEFIWAQHVMAWFKRQLRRFQSWTRPQQTLAWLVFFLICGLFGYSYLLALGPPGWLPTQADVLLTKLPGV